MCLPNRPSPDNYDTNIQVKPHFAKTPGLTPIPRTHYLRPTADAVKHDVSELYRSHGLKRCKHHGLYWAGSKRWTDILERDKTMLMVVELAGNDVGRWRDIDGDARRILRKHDLDGLHGVCVRYYRYWRDNTDSDAEDGGDGGLITPSSSGGENDAGDEYASTVLSDLVRRSQNHHQRHRLPAAFPASAAAVNSRAPFQLHSSRGDRLASRLPALSHSALPLPSGEAAGIEVQGIEIENADADVPRLVPGLPPPASDEGMEWMEVFKRHADDDDEER